jgi:thiol-disulfide isomerase/thioredoxin
MTPLKLVAALLMLATFSVAVSPAQEKKIVMAHVKYNGLKQEILKQRGKVVLVDFWATWCPNCLKKFPDFIDMQKEYADKGLVVLAVSLDSVEKEGAVEQANKFLNRQNPPFRNLLLDEPAELWEKKFEIASLPCYYLFDRHGKWVRYRASDYKDGENYYDDLKKTALKMLNEK